MNLLHMDNNDLNQFNKEGLEMLYRLRSSKSRQIYSNEWIKLKDMTDEMILNEIEYLKDFIRYKTMLSSSPVPTINKKEEELIYIFTNISVYKRKIKIKQILNK